MEKLSAITTNGKTNRNYCTNKKEFKIYSNEDTRFWQDSHQFLYLLPPEVWDHICSFLHSSAFLSLTNSSLFFRELFLQKRVLALFQPVLEILLPKLPELSASTSINKEYRAKICSIIVSCRQVCKTWKCAIDKKASNFKPEETSDKSLAQYLFSENYTFQESLKIDKFLQHFQTTHTSSVNPSPGRYIKLNEQLMRENFPEAINRISTILERYGNHIWTFQAKFWVDQDNLPELHQNIVEWLNHMPNLKNLFLFYYVPMRSNVRAIPTGNVPLEHLLPKLQSLRKLGVQTFCPTVPGDWIPEWGWLERYNLSKLINQHSNLDYLKITLMNKNDFSTFEKFTSPLKTLLVQYHCKESEVNLSEVFSMLSQKFSDTLENLSLICNVNYAKDSWHLQIMQDSFNCRLNLPKVRKIDIEMRSVFCLDFLLGMKENLEEFTIYYFSVKHFDYNLYYDAKMENIELVESKQTILFLGYQNKMLESNIWSMLPKLQKISMITPVDELCFKRKDWIKRQQMKALSLE